MAEYFYPRRRKTLLSPGRTPPGRYALPLCGFRGRTAPHRGACVQHLERAPRRGLYLFQKHPPLPPEADSSASHFFTSFPGAGSRKYLLQSFERAFFFGSPKPFLFGPLQKEMGSGTSRPGTGSLQTISFLRKRNGPHPKEKLGRGRAEYFDLRRRATL